MSYKFTLYFGSEFLKGSKSYPTGSQAAQAAQAAASIICQLSGSVTYRVESDFPDIGNWKPDEAEIRLLSRLKDGDLYNRLISVGFIKDKAGCTLEDAQGYFQRHFL